MDCQIPEPRLLQGKRVLLAEDNLINQTVAKKMLSQMGMTVVIAANGSEAVDAVAAPGARFDVVLMDMAMPVMGGVSATKVRGLCVLVLVLDSRSSQLRSWSCLCVHGSALHCVLNFVHNLASSPGR